MSKFRQEVEVASQPQINPELEGFIEKVSKPKAYETQKRQSYMIDIELIKRMDDMSKMYPRGFKVWLVNKAIEEKLNRLEGILPESD